MDEVCLLIGQGEQAPLVVSSARELLDQPDVPLLVLPPPEQEADLVEQLAVLRDRLNQRTAPAVLFLQRDGLGAEALAAAPALASFLHGVIVDPEAEEQIDLDQERRRFVADAGLTPEDWLELYRAEQMTDTFDNALLHLRALLLEVRR